MSFTLNEDADIYVAMDAEPTQRPQWLADYEITGLFIENDANEGTKMPVYRKRFKKGATVTPGENRGKLMYTIILLPVTMLQPATDLRPTITYKADNVQLQGEGIATDTAVNKKVARFVNSKQGSAVFALTPGVADLYALRIKYYNQTDKTFKANIKLLAADNTVMKEEELTFKPVAKNKSGTIATTTGTSINAGNYKLVITAVAAEGLMLTGIEMQ
jgi:beta-galactosidase